MGKGKAKQQPKLVDHISESDDEEIEEEEAFNSDDERKFGGFFDTGKVEESDESSDDDDDDDEEEEEGDGDGGRYMLDLLDRLDSSAPSVDGLAAKMKESEFSASVVQGANLTLDALMRGLEDTKGFGVMQKAFRGETTPVPVADVVAKRAERRVHYQDQSQEVSQWLEAVQQNRRADTLDFCRRARLDVLTKHELVDKFVPTTNLEKQLHEALQQASDKDIQKREEDALEDDLGAREWSLEEYKKRHGQLAKTRALMFYHEQKRHHMNKIKSKTYRRIRKKQRERLKEAVDPVTEEKEEMERVKERMTLAHKNTSKWAQRVLKRGKNVDLDTRRALSAQLKRGDDLRKKMNATNQQDDDDDDSEEDLVETARKVLADTEKESNEDMAPSGLFQLSFMQRGMEMQRERAKEEARKLLQELEENQTEQSEEPKMTKKKKKKVASKEEMKNILGDGKLAVELGKSSEVKMSGGIHVDLPAEPKGDKDARTTTDYPSSTSRHESTIEISVDQPPADAPPTKKSKPKKKKAVQSPSSETRSDDANPWLAVANDAETKKATKKKKKNQHKGVNKSGVVDMGSPADWLTPAPTQEDKDDKEGGIAMLSQEELVRRAFAGPKDVEEEFAKEKAEMEERDDPTRKQNETSQASNGWGSWAGLGAPPPKQKKHPAPPKQKPKRKRRDEAMPNVIINEKRMKKTANKYQIPNIPHPYASREEYERAMMGAIGKEWNVSACVKDLTRPEVLTRAGKIIKPISKRMKPARPAAKF